MNRSAAETRSPMVGDIVMARFRWSQDGADRPGRKIRPCMVVKAASDGDSVILAPISTKEAFDARDGIEIRPDERKTAGLSPSIRSFVKLTEINRVDLPSSAIIPSTTPDGRLAWARGQASDAVLQQVQMEIGRRVSDKTLKGCHVKADTDRAPMHLSGLRVVKRADQDRDVSKIDRVRARAAEKATRHTEKTKCTATERDTAR